jgi:hypothetical protein
MVSEIMDEVERAQATAILDVYERDARPYEDIETEFQFEQVLWPDGPVVVGRVDALVKMDGEH